MSTGIKPIVQKQPAVVRKIETPPRKLKIIKNYFTPEYQTQKTEPEPDTMSRAFCGSIKINIRTIFIGASATIFGGVGRLLSPSFGIGFIARAVVVTCFQCTTRVKNSVTTNKEEFLSDEITTDAKPNTNSSKINIPCSESSSKFRALTYIIAKLESINSQEDASLHTLVQAWYTCVLTALNDQAQKTDIPKLQKELNITMIQEIDNSLDKLNSNEKKIVFNILIIILSYTQRRICSANFVLKAFMKKMGVQDLIQQIVQVLQKIDNKFPLSNLPNLKQNDNFKHFLQVYLKD